MTRATHSSFKMPKPLTMRERQRLGNTDNGDPSVSLRLRYRAMIQEGLDQFDGLVKLGVNPWTAITNTCEHNQHPDVHLAVFIHANENGHLTTPAGAA